MKVTRSVGSPPTPGITFDDRWGTVEAGLVTSWLRGLEMALEKPELAEAARNGRLVVLPWKGGVEKAIKAGKVGVFNYLAMWQGLRSEDLSLDPDAETTLVCSGTGVPVLFTGDFAKYSQG